jgi:outer membrane lipoprotein-sorting protein
MVIAMNRNRVVLVSALTAAALGAAGLAALALPAGAGPQPDLPPVSATDLLASVMSVQPPAMNGTIELDNALGLPMLPGLTGALGDGSTTIRVWYDGDDRKRVSLPDSAGERTVVDDGTTVWTWESRSRTVTKATPDRDGRPDSDPNLSDPASAARELLAVFEPTSEIAVDGTAMVADRPAYELVVSPKPTERTLLREVRVAIDSETRLPLRLSVVGNGTDDPVLSLGFSSIEIGPQDDSLFTYTPPDGAEVTEVEPGEHADKPGDGPFGGFGGLGGLDGMAEPTAVGDGWDTVLVADLPDEVGAMFGGGDKDSSNDPRGRPGGFDPSAFLDRIGTAVDGPWGSGRLISTTVVSVILTEDGRVAVGAVPQQVLVEALSR